MKGGTLEEIRLVPVLQGLEADLSRFTNTPAASDDPDRFLVACANGPAVDNGELSDEIHSTFSLANNVIRDFSDAPDAPEFLLTASAVRAAKNLETAVVADETSDQLCFEAEPRLIRTLGLNEQGAPLPAGHAPAGVTYDMSGTPYGYIKSSGRHAGLAWQSASVATSGGEVHIPAGAFFTPIYGDGKVSVLDLYRSDRISAVGLISLEKAPIPDDIRIERFSAMLVRREMARAAYRFAAGSEPRFPQYYLHYYIPETFATTVQTVGRRVQSLLQQDLARAA